MRGDFTHALPVEVNLGQYERFEKPVAIEIDFTESPKQKEASLIDSDGKDWISYKPEGGPEGSYRGIPNIALAGFHPGPGEKNKMSRIVATGPLRAEVRSETEDYLDFTRVVGTGPETDDITGDVVG